MTEAIATIQKGQVKGIEDTDLFGEKFYKFLAIPYAKPPVGQLRFKAPHELESWNDIRDCTKDGGDQGCLCYNGVSKEFMGSEDCLYLNVFTKQLPRPELKPKPVMVFIHGGGFTAGMGSMGGPKHLLTQDIIFVTFSYRTGIFGFLSSDDVSLNVPGNAGLKDQTFALKWIQDNISSFNGDPNNVTIFGVSAGGASVSFQILSPSAKGLYHKAIVQSGTALSPWAWGQKNLIQVAEKAGKKVSTEREALDVLMNIPDSLELLKAALEIPDVLSQFDKRRPFGPVIEKPNPTAFLTESPLDLLSSGRYNQVPIIQGITSNEGMIFEIDLVGRKDTIKPSAIWYLDLEGDKEKSTKIAKSVETLYFSNGMTKDAIYKYVGDVMFMYDAVESTKLISKTSAYPVYMYVYSRDCALSRIMKKMIFRIEDDSIKGVGHGGDQMVLLDTQMSKLGGIEVIDDELDAVNQLVKIWTDFARTGNPHPDWKPVTKGENLQYFDIDKVSTLKENPFGERFVFWDKIVKDVNSINLKLHEHPNTD